MMTDILLGGSRRKLEQLAEEFEAELDERFSVRTDISCCGKFSGTFDLQELRRIFDNLRSNVCKYADPSQPVLLTACIQDGNLVIGVANAFLV
jgi:signal transduction histidine kinase